MAESESLGSRPKVLPAVADHPSRQGQTQIWQVFATLLAKIVAFATILVTATPEGFVRPMLNLPNP